MTSNNFATSSNLNISDHQNPRKYDFISQFLADKADLKNMLYLFHNVVNQRLKKPLFVNSNLSVYANNNIIHVFNNFAEVYHTKGNMALLADSFQRKLIMSDFKKWLVINLGGFLFT